MRENRSKEKNTIGKQPEKLWYYDCVDNDKAFRFGALFLFVVKINCVDLPGLSDIDSRGGTHNL